MHPLRWPCSNPPVNASTHPTQAHRHAPAPSLSRRSPPLHQSILGTIGQEAIVPTRPPASLPYPYLWPPAYRTARLRDLHPLSCLDPILPITLPTNTRFPRRTRLLHTTPSLERQAPLRKPTVAQATRLRRQLASSGTQRGGGLS